MNTQVLALDVAGTPRQWVTPETAAGYYARALVAWDLGANAATFRGGFQRDGRRSAIAVAGIVAVTGHRMRAAGGTGMPSITRDKLFARDRHVCAYCGDRFPRHALSREHVLPVSRGGADSWTNLVTACLPCNARKGDRTPEEARMTLRYLPYVPSRWEDFILVNRHILADQMDYLLAKVPAQSRLRH